MRPLPVAFSILLLAMTVADAQSPPALRLGDSVRPIRFALDLTLDPKQNTFDGQVDISLQMREAVSHFWLNATNLEVKNAELEVGGKTRIAKIMSGGEDFVGFSFEEPVPAGPAHLRVTYRGKINHKESSGIFDNKVQDDAYLFTQFESIDARRAFPCFDEPGFKVPWQLTLRVPKQDRAFANTSVVSEKEEGDHRVIQFAETKPLPSYLVAFAVGPLEIVEAGTAGKNKIPVRIIVPRGTRDQAQYAASVTAEILTRLEDYFGVPYPYEKSDSVAVPISFGGAMENPGLVTYDQTLILAKAGQDSPQRQRSYAEVAAHELAHQWFGDLVTMAWWNDTWLNEAFATWMASKLIADWKPEWQTRVADQNTRLTAMRQDSMISARRINQPAESKSDIVNAFDAITYLKGGAVIGMFEAAMGEEKFRRGVQSYLKQYAFRNARAEDFLAALSNAGGKEIAPAFATFLNQAGVPEVSAALRCATGKKPTLALSQQRSLPLGSAGSAEQTWHIPICIEYSTGGKKMRQCTSMKTRTAELELENGNGCPDWVLPNSGETGYYRVKYEGDLLTRLLRHNRQALSLPEQVGLLGNVVALTSTGTLPARDALAIVPSVKDDPHRQIITSAISIVSNLTSPIIIARELWPNRVRFVQKMFGERARALGWVASPAETEDDRLLRPPLVSFVASGGEDAKLMSAAKELSLRWLTDRKVVTSDVAGVMLASAARTGDTALYEQFLAAAKRETDPREKEILMSGLAAFRDPALIQRNFSYLLDGTFDPRQSFSLLYTPTREPAVMRMPMDFVKSHYEELAAKLPNNTGFSLLAYLPFVATAGCGEQERAEAEAFFRPRMEKVTGGPRNLDQALETIHLCEARKRAQQAGVAEFLRAY